MRRVARLLMASLALVGAAGCVERGPLDAVEPPDAMEPAEGQSWLDYGESLLELGEPRQAERAFTRSIAREGVAPEALLGLGLAAARQGLLTKARRHLEQARGLAPEDPHINNTLGVVLYTLGEYHEARRAFQTAFLTSSGRSEVAALNLRRSEEALERLTPESEPNPAISHRIQRMGESEFFLLDAEAETEAEAEGGLRSGKTSTGTPG